MNYKKMHLLDELITKQCYTLVISHASTLNIMLKYFINRKHHIYKVFDSLYIFKCKNYILSSMSSLFCDRPSILKLVRKMAVMVHRKFIFPLVQL